MGVVAGDEHACCGFEVLGVARRCSQRTMQPMRTPNPSWPLRSPDANDSRRGGEARSMGRSSGPGAPAPADGAAGAMSSKVGNCTVAHDWLQLWNSCVEQVEEDGDGVCDSHGMTFVTHSAHTLCTSWQATKLVQERMGAVPAATSAAPHKQAEQPWQHLQQHQQQHPQQHQQLLNVGGSVAPPTAACSGGRARQLHVPALNPQGPQQQQVGATTVRHHRAPLLPSCARLQSCTKRACLRLYLQRGGKRVSGFAASILLHLLVQPTSFRWIANATWRVRARSRQAEPPAGASWLACGTFSSTSSSARSRGPQVHGASSSLSGSRARRR